MPKEWLSDFLYESDWDMESQYDEELPSKEPKFVLEPLEDMKPIYVPSNCLQVGFPVWPRRESLHDPTIKSAKGRLLVDQCVRVMRNSNISKSEVNLAEGQINYPEPGEPKSSATIRPINCPPRKWEPYTPWPPIPTSIEGMSSPSKIQPWDCFDSYSGAPMYAPHGRQFRDMCHQFGDWARRKSGFLHGRKSANTTVPAEYFAKRPVPVFPLHSKISNLSPKPGVQLDRSYTKDIEPHIRPATQEVSPLIPSLATIGNTNSSIAERHRSQLFDVSKWLPVQKFGNLDQRRIMNSEPMSSLPKEAVTEALKYQLSSSNEFPGAMGGETVTSRGKPVEIHVDEDEPPLDSLVSRMITSQRRKRKKLETQTTMELSDEPPMELMVTGYRRPRYSGPVANPRQSRNQERDVEHSSELYQIHNHNKPAKNSPWWQKVMRAVGVAAVIVLTKLGNWVMVSRANNIA
jgi:hypothetical protein